MAQNLIVVFQGVNHLCLRWGLGKLLKVHYIVYKKN